MASEGEDHNPYYVDDERQNVTVRNRITRTELLERIESLEDEIAILRDTIADNRQTIQDFRDSLQDSRQGQEDLRRELRFLQDLISSGVLSSGTGGAGGASGSGVVPYKLKVKEPDTYDGVRDDKVLENFSWDMEEYLDSIPGLSGEAQVKTAARYLVGNAKLWWRTRAEDKAAGRDVVEVENWVQLKQALRDQFLPGNMAWKARDQLRDLRHTGKVADYIRAFSSLMLQIKDMTEEDRFYNFMEGLQSWAQAELRRARVTTLAEAIKVADSLNDFRAERTNRPPPSQPKSSGQDKGKAPIRPQGGAKNSGSRGKGKSTSSHFQSRQNRRSSGSSSDDSTGHKSPSGNRNSGRKFESRNNPSNRASGSGCYTCGGDHYASRCPERKLNAIQRDESGSPTPRLGATELVNCTEDDFTPDQLKLLAQFVKARDTLFASKGKGKERASSPCLGALRIGCSNSSDGTISPPNSDDSTTDQTSEFTITSPKSDVSSPKKKEKERKVDKILCTTTYNVYKEPWKKRRVFLVRWKNEEVPTWEEALNMGQYDREIKDFFRAKGKFKYC